MSKPFWVFYSVQSIYQDPLDNLALSSIFPSGWEIINTRVTGENLPVWVQNMKLYTGAYMDIRDDRVNWFFNCPAHQRLVFGIKLNPTFRGSYILPPVVVEAMYSPEFYARIRGGTVSVE
jgi:uncharacterized protein YfaS (alpha-2-macroglobulin family)